MEGLTYSSPAVDAEGTVYIGSSDSVFAIRANGSRKWSFPVGDYAISSPSLTGNGTVYLGSRDRHLYGLHTGTGTLRGTPFEAPDEIWASPTRGPDGTIYFGAFDGTIYALNPSTGRPSWTFHAGGEIISTAAIGHNGSIYVGSTNDSLYALRPDGGLEWTIPLGGDIISSPAVDRDGTIYVGSTDNHLYAVTAQGTVKWAADLGAEVISSPAIGEDGSVYVGSRDGRLYALNSENGNPLWAPFKTEDQIISSPAIDGNRTVYIGSFDGRLYAVDGQNGTLKWSYQTDGAIWSSPSLGPRGTLYIASVDTVRRNGALYAIGSMPFDVTFPDPLRANQPATVEISRPDGFAPRSGVFAYRRGGERDFNRIPLPPLSADRDRYEITVPDSFSSLRGLEYFVTLTDGEQTATWPAVRPQNRPAVEPVFVPSDSLPIHLSSQQYSMVSVPLVLDDTDLQATLEDDYGPYSSANWRLFRWWNGRYHEYPNLRQGFEPGNAFFLITANGRPFTIENARSTDSSQPYTLLLEPGWNQVGNPFAFPVAWNRVHDPNHSIKEIAFYDGTEWIQDPDRLSVLEPWTGYFVRNSASRPVRISLPPEEAGIHDEVRGKSEIRAGTTASFEKQMIQISARIPGTSFRDTQNRIGFAGGATTGEDRLDLREAPPLAPTVQLSIVEGDRYYARNVKPATGRGHRWELVVRPLQLEYNQEIEITLHLKNPLPSGFAISAVDLDHDRTVEISNHRFTIKVDEKLPVRRFALLVGSDAYRSNAREAVAAPSSVELYPNFPNPFNPETTIRFRLPGPSHVTLSIYDSAGRLVKTLVDDTQPSGRYKRRWDGTNAAGDKVGSGLYFYQLSTEDYTVTRSMVLLR
jgi:outer membrane protein assembly factor BamB